LRICAKNHSEHNVFFLDLPFGSSLFRPTLSVLRGAPLNLHQTQNSPPAGVQSDIGGRDGVAENVVLISARGGDGDEIDATCQLVDDVEIATEPVDCQRHRLQQTRHLDLPARSAVQLRLVYLSSTESKSHDTQKFRNSESMGRGPGALSPPLRISISASSCPFGDRTNTRAGCRTPASDQQSSRVLLRLVAP